MDRLLSRAEESRAEDWEAHNLDRPSGAVGSVGTTLGLGGKGSNARPFPPARGRLYPSCR